MTLAEYFKKHRGSRVPMAKAMGIDPVYLSQMSCGFKPVPVHRALQIAALTQGEVSVSELRSDLSWLEAKVDFAQAAGHTPRRSLPVAD
ncbi:YdaS family helix-turn-helix protein [Laribacter hongkongensis]|uniref:YdaS family helix-turn-helix protein n=1 Tax=Laribacter hongkongensis TaxID=168471 RepID=UPI001EFDCC51|nr:YdaS family helix-turn-helix protein [Laribacter hongkongensis]MCG9076219.1 helix-turn-helix domain-containing protein [Laribacter hongkongensis]